MLIARQQKQLSKNPLILKYGGIGEADKTRLGSLKGRIRANIGSLKGRA